MNAGCLLTLFVVTSLCLSAPAAELSLAGSPGADKFILFGGKTAAPILVEANGKRAEYEPRYFAS